MWEVEVDVENVVDSFGREDKELRCEDLWKVWWSPRNDVGSVIPWDV